MPVFVALLGLAALAMLVPAGFAWITGDIRSAEAFLLGAFLFGTTSGLVTLALNGRGRSSQPTRQLLALLSAFSLLPLALAVPFWMAQGQGSFFDAWFEMVSSFTTTGATLHEAPFSLPPALHLWRALVGWLGGLLTWVAAVALFAPLSLGGFEVRAGTGVPEVHESFSQVTRVAAPHERLRRFTAVLAPIYAGLTALLWLALMVSGQEPFVALCHAMSTLATSGISPTGGLSDAGGGLLSEAFILIFFVFALSRLTFGRGLLGEEKGRLVNDPEFQLGMILIAGVAGFLFVRHWVASGQSGDPVAAWEALWGGLFTTASFLTTTGFESRTWVGAAHWSGLQAPGLVLIGLSLVGGGIATTAGGVKLLRVYALYKHGLREIERLVHPSSVGGAGAEARRIRRQGAVIAWVFFMLFALSIAGFMLLLALTGVNFEAATVLTVAALSNTGPLAAFGAENPISYASVPELARLILAGAMILGRLELLAIIALLNPDVWRR